MIQAKTHNKDFYIESNPGLWGIVTVLNKVLPNSNFIHIIRDGKTWVRSAMNRSAFTTKDPFTNVRLRATDFPNDKYSKVWNELSRFEKICWMWNKKNSILKESVNENNNIITIKFEDLFNKGNYETHLRKLLKFFDIPINDDIINLYSDMLNIKINKNNDNSFPQYEFWSSWEKQRFKEICGNIMDYYNYEY